MNQTQTTAFLKDSSARATVLSRNEDNSGNEVYVVQLENSGEVRHLGSNDVILLGEVQFTK